jgi:hypothetical protein
LYKTKPSLLIPLLRFLADLEYIQNPELTHNWDLSDQLSLFESRAICSNDSLLGWTAADTLTSEQHDILSSVSIITTRLDVTNVGSVPFNERLIAQIAN